jgi:hypothetical protein
MDGERLDRARRAIERQAKASGAQPSFADRGQDRGLIEPDDPRRCDLAW